MTPAPPPPRPVSAWRWWVCLLLFLATTLNYMDRVALNQMAVRIQTAFRLDDEQYSRLESGFSFAFALGAILTGVIVDRVSVRWVYPLVVFGWSAAGVLTGSATGFWSLITCRIVLGLFEAGNWPCGIRTTRAVLRPEERSFGNSLFQSGTAVGAVVTPFLILVLLRQADAAAGGSGADSWKLPFRLIGLIGTGWVALWFLTVPGRLLTAAAEPPAAAGAARYRDVFRDRRFWALLVVVIAINISWHTYRTWLPKYLMEKRGFDEAGMAGLTTWFYLTADVGSWTAGLGTLLLIRRGYGGHATRLFAFAGCAALSAIAIVVPFAPPGWPLTAVVLLFAFASLGLFPTYFALTQDVSAKHQGKVTGTLGAGAHLFLSLVMYPIEGRVIKETGSYDEVLAAAGVFPLLALGLMLRLWPARREATTTDPEGA
ncbi:MAG: yjjL 1 [Gemmataceae bacterium]|nr:yjjL 1 [Gemmataceae bacterium]